MKSTGLSFPIGEALEKIDSASAWSKGKCICISCGKSIQGDKFDTSLGSKCVGCIVEELKIAAESSDLTILPWKDLIAALEPSGSLCGRLIVLWRFLEVLKIITPKSPRDVRNFQKLLIGNLGYVKEHPLAYTVRDAAMHACIAVGDPLIPLLLSMSKPTPWQFYANVILSAGIIAPHNSMVKVLLKEAAKDNNPQICKRAQALLAANKSALSSLKDKILADGIKPELFPDNFCEIDHQKNMQGEKGPGLQLTTSEERKMKQLVDELYTADVLKRIYKTYLQVFFTEADFQIPGQFSIHKLRKDDFTSALAKIYANKHLFQQLFNSLADQVKQILELLAWEEEEYEVGYLEKIFKTQIVDSQQKFSYGQAAKYILDEYTIFQIRSIYSWKGDACYLFISPQLSAILRQYLPSPAGYDFVPLDTIDKTDFLFQSQNDIPKRIRFYYSYIEQGNIKYSGNNSKVLKNSLTQMVKYCNIDEFFDGDDNNLMYLKTNLILDFFRGVEGQPLSNPAEFLRQLFDDFFKRDKLKSIKLYEFLYHLKGGYYEYQYDKRDLEVRKSLLKLLRELPVSQWVSFENMVKYCYYRNIPIEVIDKAGGNSGALYFNIKYERSYSSGYEKCYARGRNYKEAVAVPFLKTMMFLLAAFGIVDIAYNFPENQILQERDLKYLSGFDGLKYLRLTSLGAYIIGLTKIYNVSLEEETADILLDTKRLLITIQGQDPLKTLALEKIADKISATCYKVNHNSFLKQCLATKDIKQKIDLFHTYICAKPPQIWQEFLKGVLEKMNPFVKEPTMSVYKIKEDKELISLIARDEFLKKHILKGEGYRILIALKDIAKVRSRLEEFGYFIDNL